MKLKLLFYICFALLVHQEVTAQQLPLFSQQTFNRFSFNPACAGNKNRVDVMATHRNHMIGFAGAPNTQMITISAPWQMKNLGMGLRVLNDQIGTANHLSVNLALNYVLRLGNGKLAAGLEFGMDQYGVKWSDLARVHENDDVIPETRSSILRPNAAAGLFYTTENWYLGYSVQNLIASKLSFQGTEAMNVSRVSAHHYLTMGGVKRFSDQFQIEPYVLWKGTAAAPWQIDAGMFVVIKQSYGLGVTYRTGDALVYTVKLELIEQLYLGYSYETRINSLSSFTSNSHEIMLGYYFNLLEPARKKIIHPRYYF